MTNLKKSWQALAQNVDQFFNLRSKDLTCQKGCSKCCETERTVFGVEGAIIEEHLANLDSKALQKLRNALDEKVPSHHCAFLRAGSCLIYETRPLICRSHGLVHLTNEGPHHCELNYLEKLPPQSDWLQEERLTTLLALLQKEYEKTGNLPLRLSLNEIATRFKANLDN